MTTGNETIEQKASAWLARRDRGLTPAEQDEFLQWQRDDRRHAAALARLEKTWGRLDALREWRPAHSDEPNPDLLAGATRARRLGLFAAGTVALAASVALAIFVWQPGGQPVEAPLRQHLVTAIGERQSVTLDDGTVVELNTDTVLDIEFAAAERHVWLTRGEAHFTVGADPARPFRVKARGVIVEDLSTAFSVHVRDKDVEVLVTDGSVRVDEAEAIGVRTGPLLTAGQRALVVEGAGGEMTITRLEPEALDRALAWRDGRLEFFDTPLPEIVAEFNRNNRQTLVIGDSGLAGLRMGGSFRANNVETFVRLLEGGFGVRAERTSHGETVLRRASAP